MLRFFMRRRASASSRRPHTGCEPHRLGHIERPPRGHLARREMVPRTKLLHRNAEAIGDGHKRISAAGGVALLSCAGCAYVGHRHNQFIAGFDRLRSGDLVVRGDFSRVAVQCGSNLIQRFAALHNMEAPANPVLFGNVLQPVDKGVMRSGRQMQVVRDIARRLNR